MMNCRGLHCPGCRRSGPARPITALLAPLALSAAARAAPSDGSSPIATIVYRPMPHQQPDLHVGVGLASAAANHFIGVGYSCRLQADHHQKT